MANEQQPGKQLSAQGAARRRFTRAGAAASGILLTVASQPGMAQTVCAGASGFQSGLISARNPDPGKCAGRSPGYWRQAPGVPGYKNKGANHPWPAGTSPSTKFRDVFDASGMANTYGADTSTLGYMLVMNDNWDQDNLGSHLVAAYLNVKAGFSAFQTESMLTNMWNELRHPGYFTPTAGVQWSRWQVVDYLKKTMG